MNQEKPIIFGEVLFDVFENGAKLLGGAPFNVAWHLCGFGLDPFFISSIGNDDLGAEILNKMKDWGMDIKGVQTHQNKSTGTVIVRNLEGVGNYSFEIKDNQSYDFIDLEKSLQAIKEVKPNLIVFGSLSLRNQTSKNTFKNLKEKFNCKTFVDINLRDPWWNQGIIKEIITNSTIIKLNEVEISKLEFLSEEGLDKNFKKILSKFQNELLILTKGEKGAKLFSKNNKIEKKPPKIENLIDTLGAGDAFSAVSILGILNNWNKEEILDRALEFSSAICKVKGAIFTDKRIYSQFLDKWKINSLKN